MATDPTNHAATEDFSLPPAARNLDLAVSIAAAAVPYFNELFEAEKQDGDTEAQFVLRMVYDRAAAFRRQGLVAANAGNPTDPGSHAGQQRQYQDEIAQEFTDVLNALRETI